jgi:hypothetical protein
LACDLNFPRVIGWVDSLPGGADGAGTSFGSSFAADCLDGVDVAAGAAVGVGRCAIAAANVATRQTKDAEEIFMRRLDILCLQIFNAESAKATALPVEPRPA